jgi:hypothetical protein
MALAYVVHVGNMAVVENVAAAVHEAVAVVLDRLAASEFEGRAVASADRWEVFVVAWEVVLLAANGPVRPQTIARRITSMQMVV